MAEKIGTISNRVFIKKLDQALQNGSISKKDYDDLKKKYFGKPKLIQMDLFDPDKKKQGGLMEATKRLKAQGLQKGGRIRGPKDLKERKNKRRLSEVKSKILQRMEKQKKSKKLEDMTPQEKKELRDKILKDQGKMTNPFLKFNKLGQPYMEAKRGGAAKKFPDLSGDGKVTMKDVLMGRGVIKKPKKKADGGSIFKKARERKPSGRLTVDDIKRATPRPSMTLKGGKLSGVKDAPEERARERQQKVRKALLGVRGIIKGLGKAATGPVAGIGRAGRVAGRLAKRGYGIAKK